MSINFGCGRKVTRMADQKKRKNNKNTIAFHFVFSFVFYSIIRHFQAGCYNCQPTKLRKGNGFSHACVSFCPQVGGKGSRRSHVTVTFYAFNLTKRYPRLHHRHVKGPVSLITPDMGPHCTVTLATPCLWTCSNLSRNVCQAGGSHPTGMLSCFADVIDGHVLFIVVVVVLLDLFFKKIIFLGRFQDFYLCISCFEIKVGSHEMWNFWSRSSMQLRFLSQKEVQWCKHKLIPPCMCN